MKKKSTDSSSRRKFLSLGLLGGAGLLTQSANAMIPPEEDEKVSMLTPDGKLVEVSKRVFDQLQERQKAGNKDILNWTTTQHKTEK